MDDLIKTYVLTTIDVILAAIIIAVILMLAIPSKEVYNISSTGTDYSNNIKEYKDLYMYDNTSIKGIDIVEAITKYSRIFKFTIVVGGITHTIDYETEVATSNPDIWSSDYIIKQVIPNSIDSIFKSELDIENSSITFVEEW